MNLVATNRRSLVTVKVIVPLAITGTEPDGSTETNSQPAGIPAAGSVTAQLTPDGMLLNVTDQLLPSFSTIPKWSYASTSQFRFTVN